MRHRLPVTTHRRIRTAHSRVRIAITCARRGHIDGKHQRGTARRFGALQRVTHKAAIAQHVQLEPHWALDGGRDFFNRANGHSRKGKGDPFGICRSRSLHLATTRVHPAQPNGRKGYRHRQRLVEEFCLKA
ncbi:hypothetical protein D3C78_1367610 [compost metagenome]